VLGVWQEKYCAVESRRVGCSVEPGLPGTHIHRVTGFAGSFSEPLKTGQCRGVYIHAIAAICFQPRSLMYSERKIELPDPAQARGQWVVKYCRPERTRIDSGRFPRQR